MSHSDRLLTRPLRAADRSVWTGLWRAYLEFYKTTLADAVYDSTFARLTDPNNTALNGIVAERAGTVVGLTHYIFHDHCWRPEGVTYLQDLYVAPAARGTGAGRALIEAVYAAADAADRPSVYWLTQTFNTEARQLYDRIATETPFIKYQRS